MKKFITSFYRRMRGARYAASKVTNSTGGWTPVNQNINDLIRTSSPMVRARVKQLVRDMPHFARAVRCVMDYTVGSGMEFNSLVRDADGSLDKKVNQSIEDGFARWSDEADFYGRMHFNEIQQLVKRQDVEDGEFLVVKRTMNDRNRFLPFALQVMRPDQLSSFHIRPEGKNRVDMGVEYDNQGRVVAYHFDDPDGWGKSFRVSVEHVIHGFECLQPMQLRGITPFAPGVILARDLDDFLSAEIDGAKLSAKWLAFVTTPDFMNRQSGNRKDSEGKQIEDLQNGIIEYLRPGEEIKFNDSSRPAGSFDPFANFILRTFAVTADISFELLTGNYNGINYSNLRGIRNDLLKGFRPKQERHRRQFCSPVAKPVLYQMGLSGIIPVNDFFRNMNRYMRFEFANPGVDSIDPFREGRADIEMINALIKSPQEIIRKRGRDPETVLNEIAEFKKLAEEKGLTMSEAGFALASNPAAVADENKSHWDRDLEKYLAGDIDG